MANVDSVRSTVSRLWLTAEIEATNGKKAEVVAIVNLGVGVGPVGSGVAVTELGRCGLLPARSVAATAIITRKIAAGINAYSSLFLFPIGDWGTVVSWGISKFCRLESGIGSLLNSFTKIGHSFFKIDVFLLKRALELVKKRGFGS